jgi:RimJ/RimL family protein N-acetyltransferase
VSAPRIGLEHARLVGERVELRPLTADDVASAFAELHRNEAILSSICWEGPDQPSDLAILYGDWISEGREGEDYHFAIVDRVTGAFSGCIGPRFRGHPGVGDVGYWVAERAWGRGLASEAVRLVAYLCFTHLAAERLVAQVFVGNDASRRVLEKNHFRCLRTLPQAIIKRGVPVDEWYLECERAAWFEKEGAWRPEVDEVTTRLL